MIKYELIEARYIDTIKYKSVMTIQSTRRSLWGKLLRRSPIVSNFKAVGSCTVWSFYPSFSRCPISLEIRLYELWNKADTLKEIKELKE